MLSLGYIVMLVADVASLLVIVPGHLGILLVYLHDLIRKKGLDIKDQLFCGLSICYPLHALCQVMFDFLLFLDVTLFGNFYDLIVVLMVHYTTMSCTLFFSSWLSLYFCLKIVNLNKGWYICLQRRFPKIFPWLLIFSVLGSILCSFPIAFHATEYYVTRNTTLLSFLVEGEKAYFTHPSLWASTQSYILVSSLLFTLFFISSCPIVVSLCQHMRRIQVSTAGSRIPTLEPHIYAIKTITLLMILNALYIFSLIIVITNGRLLEWHFSSVTLFNISHIVSLVISIRGNQKLKVTIRNLLQTSVSSGN